MIKRILDYFRRKTKKKLVLTGKHCELWKGIEVKIQGGQIEWESKSDKNLYSPWCQELSKEEDDLLYRVHEYFYPGDYIVDPVGADQANRIWFDDVRDKVELEDGIH